MNRYAAQQPSNTSKMASNVMSGAKDMASKVGAGAKDMASKVGAGAKDMATQAGGAAKDFAGRMADKVGDAVQSRRMAGVNKQLADTVARKFGSGATTNQLAAQGYNQAAKQAGKQAGKQALKQGAKGLLGRAAGTLAGGPATAIAAALTPSQIGGGENDPEQKFIKEQMARSNRAKEMKGQKPGKYVLQNAPERSRRQAQEKFNAGVDQALGLKGEQKAAAPQEQKKQQYGIKNPYSSDAISNAKSFGQAFKQARKEIGAGGVFEYGGKKYNTYTQGEMKDMAAKGTGKGNKFFEDYDRRKDFTGSQDAPASKRAYYANKQRPSAQKQAAPAERQATAAPATTQKPMNMKDFAGTNYKKDITDVERMKAARGEMPASRPSTKEIRGLKDEAYNRMNNRVKASRDYQAAKEANNVKAMKNAKAMFESNKPNDKAYNKMKSRIEDNRFQNNRFTDYRPSRKETEAMTRSEDSSIEKLKKHMEKQKTSKKEGV